MGQQQSKRAEPSLEKQSDSLQSYPSISKADTRESSRSIRESIRSRIGKPESPRGSVVGLSPNDKSETGSVRSSASPQPRHFSNDSIDSAIDSVVDDEAPTSPTSQTSLPTPQPPPSPRYNSSVSKGHQDVSSSQTAEVGQVSDAPPSNLPTSSTLMSPGESILMKRSDMPNPVIEIPPSTPPNDRATANGSPTIGLLKSIDLDDMITRLLDAGYSTKVTKSVCLRNAEITAICAAARELFLAQPALLELSAPVKIVGDVHGQYTDLIRLFEMCGFPPAANYLFLGDYVDRGKQSLETILLLFCYKLKYPDNFFLLRGNHECANVTRVYGFYDECKRRCNIKIWKTFVDTFNTLPIASTVAGKIFCVHGGLSPSLSHMSDVRGIVRPTDVPDYGLLNDLLWSDPAEMDEEWEANERGVSYCFNKQVILDFLQRHDLDLVCRAHMVVEDGYEFFSDRILVTVFSAPNVSLFFCWILSYTNLSSTVVNLTTGVPSCRFPKNCSVALSS